MLGGGGEKNKNKIRLVIVYNGFVEPEYK